MNYNIEILNESGYEEAMLGLSLSFNQPISNMKGVSDRLYDKDGGHNKFLESVCVWIDIKMPRYWWGEADTYRIGVTKQSESTMHTITKRLLTQEDFIEDIYETTLVELNKETKEWQELKENFFYKDKIEKSQKLIKLFRSIKRNLPEGFLQRRIICTNYKTIRHIIAQRKNHKLEEWLLLCNYLINNCRYKEWLKDLF